MKEIRLLRAEEIECRIARTTAKGVQLLLYKTARTDMDILDEVFSPTNWQKSYELIDGQLFCTISIYDFEKGMWISKQDVGTESNTEPEKGRASDAMKRAGFLWGIGRELYTAPKLIWFNANECNLSDGKCYDNFDVISIEYDGRKIRSVTIGDTKTEVIKTFGNFNQNGRKSATKKKEPAEPMKNSELFAKCMESGINPIWVAGKCGYNTVQEIPEDKAMRCVRNWDALIAKFREENE